MNGALVLVAHLLLEPGLVQPLVLVQGQLLALVLQVLLQVELQLQVVQLLLVQLLLCS